MEYEKKKREKLAAKKKRNPTEDQNKALVADFLGKDTTDTSMNCEFISEDYIDAQKLVPKKVLNIAHIKDNEKSLVVQILFEGLSKPVFVYAPWANQHCPQLVIAYYEKRIFWEKKS